MKVNQYVAGIILMLGLVFGKMPQAMAVQVMTSSGLDFCYCDDGKQCMAPAGCIEVSACTTCCNGRSNLAVSNKQTTQSASAIPAGAVKKTSTASCSKH